MSRAPRTLRALLRQAGLALGGLALLWPIAGCGGDEPAGERGAGTARAPEAPALGPVVAEAIAALEQRIAAEDPPPPPPEEAAIEAAAEPTAGLVEALAQTPAREPMRRVLLEELVGHGDAAVPHLAALLADTEAEPEQRTVAAEVLGALDSLAATEPLLATVESARTEVEPEHWLIAQCAWRLADTTQDWILPRVLRALRYETDHETVLWLADTAARFGNYAGLEGLRVIVESGSETAGRAAGLRAQLTAGFDSPQAAERAWALRGEVAEAYRHQPSPRLELETWRLIESLAEWQLRGVDDARFVLSRSGTGAARLLGRALSDQDLYVRVHSAQCLERMGPRGRVAIPELVRALADPSAAAAAAAGLGGCAWDAPADRERASAALVGCLSPSRSLELRVAAARALGQVHLGATRGTTGADDGETSPARLEAAAALAELFEDEEQAIDLRAAAAGALVRIGALEELAPTVRWLQGLLTSPAVEPTEVEAALWDWLERQPGRAELRAAWVAAAVQADARERLARRAELVGRALE